MSKVIVNKLFAHVQKKIKVGAKEGFDTVALDIQRTTSGASPFKTGVLQSNHLDIDYGKGSWLATIYFVADNNVFDYAEWTHEATYNLGPKSQAKPDADSKFAGIVPVGRKYATRVVEQGEDAYKEHITNEILDALGK